MNITINATMRKIYFATKHIKRVILPENVQKETLSRLHPKYQGNYSKHD
jgi:hypothetical protein